MSAFEFFFSLFGLILGLGIATVAAGMSDVLRERKRIPIGVLTPMLAVFLLIDVTSFWIFSWHGLQDIRIGYAPLIWAVSLAVIYFFSVSMLFPKKLDDWATLDDYYMEHHRWVIGGVLLANIGLYVLILLVDPASRAQLFVWEWFAYFSIVSFLFVANHRRAQLIGLIAGLVYFAILVAQSPSLT
jgi:hypothetical protein